MFMYKTAMQSYNRTCMATAEMKCGLFNDPFDYYGHRSGNSNRLHKLFWGTAVGVG